MNCVKENSTTSCITVLLKQLQTNDMKLFANASQGNFQIDELIRLKNRSLDIDKLSVTMRLERRVSFLVRTSHETFISLETLDHHNQIHNDIKPQNYLVKFLTTSDLSRIEIVLTDFGLAGSDSKGGTPIFASPECLANPDRKNMSSDVTFLYTFFVA